LCPLISDAERSSMKVGAIIPARKGSKGIPGKNFKDFCGIPLWQWTYSAAVESGVFDQIILSTDEKSYFHIIDILDERPDHLCDDKASLDDVLVYYAQKHPDIDVWCLLQPTSPLRTAEDITGAFEMLQEETKGGEKKYDSVVSVFNHPIIGWMANCVYHKGRKYHAALYHTEKRPNRQDRQDWYLENGAVYFVTIEGLKQRGSRIGITPGLYVMPKERSIEIDDPLDWDVAEFLMKRGVK